MGKRETIEDVIFDEANALVALGWSTTDIQDELAARWIRLDGRRSERSHTALVARIREWLGVSAG